MSSSPPPGPPQTQGDQDLITPEQGKDPMVILVLAILFNPIAYFVYGQWQKGLAGIGAWLVGIALAVITCGAGGVLLFPLSVAIVVDAFMQAQLLQQGRTIGQWTFFNQHK